VKVCVLGAGAWGTALAIHLARNTSVTYGQGIQAISLA